MEKVVPKLNTLYARLEYSPFTTIVSMLNFYVNIHYDEIDSGFGIIAWFKRFFNPHTCNRSLFRFINYSLFLRPRQEIFNHF